tara:strand:- start:4364 stop:6151 length:1788 start_codon:yes stop_codon:yes gene_type:complete
MKSESMENDSGFEGNWASATLGEIIAGNGVFTDGDWVESKDQDENGDVRLIQLADIGDGVYKDKSARFMNTESAEDLHCTYIEKGDVLVARMPDPLGRACIFPGDQKKSVTVVDVCILRPAIKGIDNKWLMYWINSPVFRNKIADLQSGTTRRRISRKNLASIKFPLPPSKLQVTIREKIEELFSHIDAGVEGLKQAKAKLQQYRQSVLKDAVTGKLTEQWRERHADKLEPADQLLARILEERRANWEAEQLKIFEEKGKLPKDDKWKEKYKEPPIADISLLPEIPVAWVWSTITELGELNRGKSKHRPRNDPSLYGGDYPFVQTGDVRAADGLLTTYKQTYSEKGLAQSRLWPEGTMCITIAANIAETAILGLEACFPDSVVGFIPQNEDVSVEYIEFFFRTAKEDLDRYAPATAQKNINLAILETVSVPFMSVAEQRELVLQVTEKLDATKRAESTIDAKMKNSASLKSSILAKAFAGDLVPNNSNESAQELLEKIKAEKDQLIADKPKGNSKGKSKVNSERKPLLAALNEKTKAISPDELMQEAGFTSADIDDFYLELASIAEKIEQVSPDKKKLINWPYEKESNVKIKLKE